MKRRQRKKMGPGNEKKSNKKKKKKSREGKFRRVSAALTSPRRGKPFLFVWRTTPRGKGMAITVKMQR